LGPCRHDGPRPAFKIDHRLAAPGNGEPFLSIGWVVERFVSHFVGELPERFGINLWYADSYRPKSLRTSSLADETGARTLLSDIIVINP
jgi:hypothetical protein